MLRTAVALVVSMSFTAPAFAQQQENKLKDSVTKIKEYITAYDSGTATTLAKVGGKVALWSFAAYGAATLALLPATETPWLLGKAQFYTALRNPQGFWLANRIKDGVGATGAGVGMSLLLASAVTYFAQHVWYGWLGHADQNAALAAEHQEYTKYFVTHSADEIYADAQANPELAARLISLANALN